LFYGAKIILRNFLNVKSILTNFMVFALMLNQNNEKENLKAQKKLQFSLKPLYIQKKNYLIINFLVAVISFSFIFMI
jgi:hypothetical protein